MPDLIETQNKPIRLEDKNCPVATLLQLDGESRRASLYSDGRIYGGMYGWTNAEPIKPELVETFRNLSSDKQELVAIFMGTFNRAARSFNVVAVEGPSTRVVTPVLSGYDATSLQHTEVRLAVPQPGFESLKFHFEPDAPPALAKRSGPTADSSELLALEPDAPSALAERSGLTADLSELFALKPGPSVECAARTLIESQFLLQVIANPDSRLVTATFRRKKRSLTPAVEASLSWIRG
jgi:hypothetical protein